MAEVVEQSDYGVRYMLKAKKSRFNQGDFMQLNTRIGIEQFHWVL